jgi:hypothetical protein
MMMMLMMAMVAATKTVTPMTKMMTAMKVTSTIHPTQGRDASKSRDSLRSCR